MKTTCAFTLSHDVIAWLTDKKKKCINLSSLVNSLLEAEMIKEMENNENEDIERIPSVGTDNASGSATTPAGI